jgi:dipeptidyl aminopeptidase/acylaminoacyl peptidase
LGQGASQAAVRDANPATHIKTGYPPTILFHGLSDVTVDPKSSIELLAMLRAANVPSELHTFARVPHEFDEHSEFAEQCADLIDFFLDRYILNPRTYPPFMPGGAPGRGPAVEDKPPTAAC